MYFCLNGALHKILLRRLSAADFKNSDIVRILPLETCFEHLRTCRAVSLHLINWAPYTTPVTGYGGASIGIYHNLEIRSFTCSSDCRCFGSLQYDPLALFYAFVSRMTCRFANTFYAKEMYHFGKSVYKLFLSRNILSSSYTKPNELRCERLNI